NGADIDGVSNATVTSDAVKEAVTKCLEEAAG
ncbi:MAG: FMN-binding protein, partial [Erysipelotrichaceae bacterium]|nr:FMN-binding protein [Erysipelotrichaceae bacterium]